MRIGMMRTLTRADEVRQRRQEQAQKNVNRASKRAVYATTMPAVVTRGGAGTPVARRAVTRPRKKMVIPLKSPGAELQMPSIPVIHVGWRLLSGFTALAAAGMLFILLKAPFLVIGNPEVSGAQRLPAGDIMAVSGASGKPIVGFDPAVARYNILSAYPDLQTVDIRLGIPARAMIFVAERQPFIEWQCGDEKKWIDEHGVVFTAHEDGGVPLMVQSDTQPPVQQPAVPVEEVAFDTARKSSSNPEPVIEQLDSKLFASIKHLSSLLPQGTILIYNNSQGLGWYAEEGWRVYVGTWLDDLDTKIEVYEAIVDYLARQGITPGMISVAQVNAPYYRMEQ